MTIYIFEMSGKAGFFNYSKNLAENLAANDKKRQIVFHTANKDYHGNGMDNLIVYNDLNAIGKKELFFPLRVLYVIWLLICNNRKRLKIIKKVKPQIVLIQQVVPIFDQFSIKKIKKKYRVYITVHDVIPPQKSFLWSVKNLEATYRNASGLIFHTESNLDFANKTFGYLDSEKIVIPHGVEIHKNKLTSLECKQRLKLDDEFTILFFGVIRESKGLSILLEAIKGLNVKLIIAGKSLDSSFNNNLSYIKDNKLNVDVYNRFIANEEIPCLFKASDILCLPYKDFNSQSGVLMQAITYGLPVVSSDVPSFKEFLNNYDIGIIFNKNDSQDLRNKIEYLISCPDILLQFKNNLLDLEKKMSWEIIAEMYFEFMNLH